MAKAIIASSVRANPRKIALLRIIIIPKIADPIEKRIATVPTNGNNNPFTAKSKRGIISFY